MNLQENIRRILLREDVNVPLYIKRRLYVVDEYISDLDPYRVCRYWGDNEVKEYVNQHMSDIVRSIIGFRIQLNDDVYTEKYGEVYGSLIDLGYRKKLEDFFYESIKTCNPKSRGRFMKP
tara:strand:+ start:1982 stop:2341 length:360 start_codon:yes stop_codon:yes gene_type:complete